jgi:predicted glycosyltransferase
MTQHFYAEPLGVRGEVRPSPLEVTNRSVVVAVLAQDLLDHLQVIRWAGTRPGHNDSLPGRADQIGSSVWTYGPPTSTQVVQPSP